MATWLRWVRALVGTRLPFSATEEAVAEPILNTAEQTDGGSSTPADSAPRPNMMPRIRYFGDED